MGYIVPENKFSGITTRINDYTEIKEEVTSTAGDINHLYVFASPKGKTGMQTIKGLGEFLDEYGMGPFNLYGQPYLMAYSGCQTGYITAHCLRVTAKNAAYGYLTLFAQYKVETKVISTNTVSSSTVSPDGSFGEGEVGFEDEEEVLKIRLVARINEETPMTDPSLLSEMVTPRESDLIDGYKEVPLFSVYYMGPGSWGNNIRIRITNDSVSDKENSYKNYILEEYEMENGTLEKKNEFMISFIEYAKSSGVPIFLDTVVNDVDSGSSLIRVESYPDSFAEIFNEYIKINPETVHTVETFDPILGIDKFTKKGIDNLEIDTTSEDVVQINSLSGVPLMGGSDGDLDESLPAADRNKTLNQLYQEAFLGNIDPMVASTYRYPTNFIYDANFDIPTKKALVALGHKRKDCVTICDCGTGIRTKPSIKDYVLTNLDPYILEYVDSIEAYVCKVPDPYSDKSVTVTGTYLLNIGYPGHIKNIGNGYKHIPFCGNNYGVLTGYVKNSAYPVFDPEVDKDLMNELVDERINFLAYNRSQDIIRKEQYTRQKRMSNLSELSNVLVVLDVKRDAEALCDTYDYDFSDPEHLVLFNRAARNLLSFYQEQQVTSIKAEFSANEWERNRNIVHLVIDMAHKPLAKQFVIEINVRRPEY